MKSGRIRERGRKGTKRARDRYSATRGGGGKQKQHERGTGIEKSGGGKTEKG